VPDDSVTCRACGKETPEENLRCIYCGERLEMRSGLLGGMRYGTGWRWLFIVFAFLFLILALRRLM
jgi:hypothetical protein